MKTKKTKMVDVEFYFLLDDSTWNTDIVEVPESIANTENNDAILDWFYKNVPIHEDVAIVGIYSF